MEKDRFSFTIDPSDDGTRLDKFLIEVLPPSYSRSFIQKLIHTGAVTVNGVPVKPHHAVRDGDGVDVTIPPVVAASIAAEKIPLDIVYEDDAVLVVNKPAGMVVHPAPGNATGTLVNALMAHCKRLSGIGGVEKPGIVHRIDKGTSGLLVVAKTDAAHQDLARQFKAHTIRRVYRALVTGVVEHDNGVIELPIGRSPGDRKKMAIQFAEGKEALTRYTVLKRFASFTYLELTLGTGRTHQIRVHLAHLGHPLVGDEKYGTRSPSIGRPALHAMVLGFVHPQTQEYQEFSSPLPRDINHLIRCGHL